MTRLLLVGGQVEVEALEAEVGAETDGYRPQTATVLLILPHQAIGMYEQEDANGIANEIARAAYPPTGTRTDRAT
jgi:hypothetical protein